MLRLPSPGPRVRRRGAFGNVILSRANTRRRHRLAGLTADPSRTLLSRCDKLCVRALIRSRDAANQRAASHKPKRAFCCER